MSLTISPELEERIVNTARNRGMAPDDLLRNLLEVQAPQGQTAKKLTLTVDEFLAETERIGQTLPKLSDYAYTRESFYEDHD
jgi:hypothetical protein